MVDMSERVLTTWSPVVACFFIKSGLDVGIVKDIFSAACCHLLPSVAHSRSFSLLFRTSVIIVGVSAIVILTDTFARMPMSPRRG